MRKHAPVPLFDASINVACQKYFCYRYLNVTIEDDPSLLDSPTLQGLEGAGLV